MCLENTFLAVIHGMSHFSIAEIRHHSKGNLFVAHSFRGLESKTTMMDSMAMGMPELQARADILNIKSMTEKELTKNVMDLETSKPTPSNTPFPTRLHLTFPKQFQLGNKYSNM